MSLLIILGALALVLGIVFLVVKAATFLATHGETIIKIALAVTVVLLILASVAYFKPDAVPNLTHACNTVAEAIKAFVKPFIA
jgi:multisubunit Na+/H+ antiporter MnhC subunit